MKILALLPRASSTEVALYDDGVHILRESVQHLPWDIRDLKSTPEEGQYRYLSVKKMLNGKRVSVHDIDASVTPGGLLARQPSGLWVINETMLDDLARDRFGKHVLNCGPFIASKFAQQSSPLGGGECLACAVDSVVKDELMPEALVSGLPEIERSPVFHVLSQRGAARAYAKFRNTVAHELNLIVAHIGSEISVGAHKKGRIIDVNSPLDGDGPFSARTCGTLPAEKLVDMCYAKGVEFDDMINLVDRKGGLAAYLPKSSLDAVEELLAAGDPKTNLMIEAMAHQISREIGARTAAFGEPVDGIVLTGPWVRLSLLVRLIRERVQWIAPFQTYVGENEFHTLVEMAAKGLEGFEEIHIYRGAPDDSADQ